MKLSDEECRILREMARDENLRRDCDKLRELRRELDAKMTPDEYIKFLTSCSRLFGPYVPRPPVVMTKALL